MYRILLFDLDGTLTNPKEGITKSAQYALDYYGIHVEDLDKLTCFIGPPLQESFQEFYGFSKEKAWEATLKFRERYGTVGLWENEIFPGMAGMLKKLKEAGKRLAVATSKPEPLAEKILDKFQISEYFEVVSGSELEGGRITKSEVIEEALRRLGRKPDDCRDILMVGDRKHDVEGAAVFGMDCMGVSFGFAEEGELEEAGAIDTADTVEELTEKLLRL